MRTLVLLLFFFLPLALSAQIATPLPSTMTAQEHQGRLLFQQRCSICHSAVMITHRPYGPILDKGRVKGDEDDIRQTITNGRAPRMPAFKYGLSAEEINAIIAYLDVLPRAPEHSFGQRRDPRSVAPQTE